MRHLFAVFCLTISFGVFAEAQDFPDSLLMQERLTKIIVQSPDSVLSLLDIAERRKLFPTYEIDIFRAQAYNELRMFSLKERFAHKALANTEIEKSPAKKLQALTLLLSADAYYAEYQQSITLANRAIELARQLGNKAAELNILLTMAKSSFNMGDRSTGYDYLNRIINENSTADNARILANVSAAYGSKVIELYADNRFEDALEASEKRLETIQQIDKLGGAPEGFTDQQRAYTYARIASSAFLSGDKERADKAFSDFMETKYGNTVWGKAYISDYLQESKNWQKLIAFTAPLFQILQEADTINDDYRSLLSVNANAQRGLGNLDEAYSLMLRASAIQDSMYIREKNSKAQELAAIFQLNEKELALANSKSEIERKNALLFSSAMIALIILIILIILLIQYRATKKRNRITAGQIDELLEQRNQLLKLSEARGETDPHSNEDKFLQLERSIVDDKLFMLPNTGRDVIAKRTGFSRAEVVRLIREFAKCSPGEFINKLKVEYSVTLIKEHPEWTIDAIAEAAGYTNRGTYYHHFNRIFGITPAQYRRESINKQRQ